MDSKGRIAFALLILVQAAHSVEECVFRLFDVFAPARWVSGLVSADLAFGFGLANACIVLFGIWCYWARVRPSHPRARVYAWLWALVELGNGLSHIFFTLLRGEYFPGVGTAPLLLATSCYMTYKLLRVTKQGDEVVSA
jgi:uncharacterized protein with HXXEE motif